MSEAAPPEANWSPSTIVVSYDGTASAEQSLDRTIQLARLFGSRVVVADVAAVAPMPLEPIPGAFGYMPYYDVGSLEEDARTAEDAWQQHRSHIEVLFAENGVGHEFDRLAADDAADLADLARRHEADLVVLRAQETGFLERIVEGSAGEAVARRAHCDVLIVHATDLGPA
jgi:nucleotide-binding universal stress UspA family protein